MVGVANHANVSQCDVKGLFWDFSCSNRTTVVSRKEEGSMGNLNVVMISVTSRDDGLRVLDRVDAATESGEINVEDVAMVYKNDKGKVKIHQTADATAGKGAVKGGGLGLPGTVWIIPRPSRDTSVRGGV